MKKLKKHWNKVYSNTIPEKTGWYQESADQSLNLIESCDLNKSATILNVGTGVSTMVNDLLHLGYQKLIVNDISKEALRVLESKIPSEFLSNIEFVKDDITQPSKLLKIPKVDLWHDRAVLHFFLKAEEQDTYFDLLKSKVKKGGYVIIAEFHTSGAPKCSGLELCRYDVDLIQEKLGSEFFLVKDFEFMFINPNGEERPYIYTLFKRQ